MKTILISAYAISPTKGSEFGVGWNFITRLAKNNKLIVLCGVSGEHMGDTLEIETYFKENPNKNITIVKIDPPLISLMFNALNKAGFGYFFYPAFYFWQKEAYRVAMNLLNEEKIDLIHQLNPIGFREPGFLWSLGKPFVWGPIGGANYINAELLVKLPLRVKFIFKIKNLLTYFQLRFSRRVKKALSSSDALLYCNAENRHNINRCGKVITKVISEQASENKGNTPYKTHHQNEKIKLIFVGSLFYIKNLYFIIDVLVYLRNRIDFHLDVVGDGYIREKLIEYAIRSGVNNYINWHGRLGMQTVLDMMTNSDLHCMCSLSEANTTVVYEAFTVRLPTISLSQNGMKDSLSNGMGFLVNIVNYSDTVIRYANKIIEIYHDRCLLDTVRYNIDLNIAGLSWNYKIDEIEAVYDEVLKNH